MLNSRIFSHRCLLHCKLHRSALSSTTTIVRFSKRYYSDKGEPNNQQAVPSVSNADSCWTNVATASAALASEKIVSTRNDFDVSFSDNLAPNSSAPSTSSFQPEYTYAHLETSVSRSNAIQVFDGDLLTPEDVLRRMQRSRTTYETETFELENSSPNPSHNVSSSSLISSAAIDMPKILFFGGDQVAIACLTGLCDRMLERLEALSLGGRGARNIAVQQSSANLDATFKDYSLLRPFIEVVCPKAPPLSELEGTNSAYRHTNFPIPRFCHKHNLRCHIVDHRNSLIKSSLNFDELLFGNRDVTGPVTVDMARTEAAISELFVSTQNNGDYYYLPKDLPDAQTSSGTVAHTNDDAKSIFDVAVVVSFRYFIPDALLTKLPPVINLHPSLLPKYRGCSPIFSTMLHGDEQGGASIIKIGPSEAMDSGDVLDQRVLKIGEDEDMRSYFPRLIALGSEMLGDTLLPKEVFVKPQDAEDENQSSLPTNPVAVSEGTIRPLPWKLHFDRLWRSASPQIGKIHFKQDPFYAPLIPRKRATHIGWEQVSGIEAYNQWRTFVGGQFFGAVSASLDKRATPVADQLLSRAISKYNKKHRPPLHNKKGSHGTFNQHVPDSEQRASSVPPPTAATAKSLPREVIDSLMQTHVTFTEAKCPTKISTATHELLGRISSGALLPGAACFPSTDESVVAIMCGKKSKPAASQQQDVLSSSFGVSSSSEIEWFFPTELMLEGSKGATTPKLLRTSLAMKLDTIYPYLFVTERNPWTIGQQQLKSQGKMPMASNAPPNPPSS